MVSTDENEATRIQAENEVMQREMAWILNTQIPPSLQELVALLREALNCCTAFDPAKVPNAASTLAVSSVNSDALKGILTVNGPMVAKGDLKIKLPNYKSQPLTHSINPQKPFTLVQVQNARNNVALALDTLDSCTPSMYNKMTLVGVLAKITDFIKRAQTSLTRLEDGAVFPQKECDTKGFVPPLPDDLIIEFFINHASVVVSVAGLSHPNRLIQGFQGLKIGGSHRTVRYKDKQVEVVDEVTVECPHPMLAHLTRLLSSAEELSGSLKSKLLAL